MHKTFYRYRNIYANSLLAWVLFIYVSIIIVFFAVWFWPNTDKAYYKSYKQYEVIFDRTLNETIDEASKYNTNYYENKVSKKQAIEYFEASSDKLVKLYDDFRWTKGDAVTKEIYTIKKQIIISYSQLYYDKAKSMENGVLPNENDYMTYITTLISHYNIKDKLQKQKFDISF
jgi:hypothetical protein